MFLNNLNSPTLYTCLATGIPPASFALAIVNCVRIRRSEEQYSFRSVLLVFSMDVSRHRVFIDAFTQATSNMDQREYI
jgi:hypothetical protein